MAVPPIPDLNRRLADYDRKQARLSAELSVSRSTVKVMVVYAVLLLVVAVVLAAGIVKLFS